MPPETDRTRVLWATIIRACLMILRALDKYFDVGIWKHD